MAEIAIAGLLAGAVALFCMLMVVGLARSLDGAKAQQDKAAHDQISKLIARAGAFGGGNNPAAGPLVGLAGLLAQGANKDAAADEGSESSSQNGTPLKRFITGLMIAGGIVMVVVGIIAGDG